jgi:diguanylate cyclase (GGDEF)-like protein
MRNVVIVIAMVLLAIGVYSILSNFGLNAHVVDVQEGSIDVSNLDYEEFPLIQLKGGWHFYLGEVVDASGTQQQPHVIQVPSSWTKLQVDGRKLDPMGYGTYRLQLKLPETGFYSILLDNIYTAFKVYVDGVLISEVGKFSTEADGSLAHFSDTIVTFFSHSGTSEVLIQVSNYLHPYAGIGVVPILGSQKDIARLLAVNHSITVFLVGIFTVSALFILFYYHKSNKDRSIIYFAALCIMLAIKNVVSNSVLGFLFPIIPTEILLKLEYVTIPLAVIAFLMYAKFAFPMVFPRILQSSVIGISSVYSVFIIIFPVRFYNPLLLPYFAIFVPVLCFWAMKMIIDFFGKREISGMILIGSLVLLFSVIGQSVYYFLSIPNFFVNKIAAMGLAFFIIAHFNDFSMRFLSAWELSQEIKLDLETKVAKRTKELNILNAKLQLLASTDELTEVYNRNELMRRIVDETGIYNRLYQSNPHAFAVIYIDLDNFKYFNDCYSHEAGDLVLKLFANLLQEKCRKTDSVFRFGGDEFVIFLSRTSEEGAKVFAQRLVLQMVDFNIALQASLTELLAREVSIPTEKQLTCSMGIAVHDGGGIDIEQLIKLADKALLQAKALGKNRYALWNGDSVPDTNFAEYV